MGSTDDGSSAAAVLSHLNRWPTWMWANEEVATFSEWLRNYNMASANKTRFYGLDVYSLWRSIEEVHMYLQTIDPNEAQSAADAVACFNNFYGGDEFAYGTQKANNKLDCADELQRMLTTVQEIAKTHNDEEAFNAVQNAFVALNAERYYVTALQSSSASWNIRDEHMMNTVDRIAAHHGDGAKVIIWAHNTHVGDARATDMASQGMVNIGQLMREKHGDEGVHITGFGTYSGTVIASNEWASETQTMTVPNARPGSWEAMLHAISPANKLILLEALKGNEQLSKSIGHRAIGVVYDPSAEQGNYVPSVVPQRYDAFIFIDRTEALHPILNASGRTNGKLKDSRLLRVNN
jgi:erythromycin esterase